MGCDGSAVVSLLRPFVLSRRNQVGSITESTWTVSIEYLRAARLSSCPFFSFIKHPYLFGWPWSGCFRFYTIQHCAYLTFNHPSNY